MPGVRWRVIRPPPLFNRSRVTSGCTCTCTEGGQHTHACSGRCTHALFSPCMLSLAAPRYSETVPPHPMLHQPAAVAEEAFEKC